MTGLGIPEPDTRDRSLKMLEEWCSFELHTMVDTDESPLEDDEFEE
jgi:hypothetical protein